MAARKQITKEQILATALEMVRADGMDSINARSLAKKLNCSTQPIYLSFSSIGQLKEAVVIEIWNVFTSYLNTAIPTTPNNPYSGFGVGYRQFARKEKEFFKFLFLQGNNPSQNDVASPYFQKSIELIMAETKFSYDKALKMHLAIWTFVHGVATMLATSNPDIKEENICELISDIYEALKFKYKKEE